MAKDQSDVFICKHAKDGYWAHPSPYVAHGGGTEIQVRNLTKDTIAIDFLSMPVHKNALTLAPDTVDYVIVNGDAKPGLYVYEARVVGRTRKVRTSTRRQPIEVQGGSPPTVIIDT